jgi:predicted transcriptional regulator
VKHRKQGRQFLYRAKVGERQAAHGAVQRLLSSFFGGKVSELTAQLLESEQLSPEELEEMRNLISQRKKA